MLRRRLVLVFLSLSVFLGTFTACFDLREIDDLAYVMAIGLDKGENSVLKMTIQLAIPQAVGGNSENGEDGDSEESSNLITVEVPTIYAGINLINNSKSKQLNLAHAKLVVVSEELAEEGIGKYVQALIRGRAFRSTAYIMVTSGTAEEYLKESAPVLEANPSKYYEQLFNPKNTALIPSTTLFDFYINSNSIGRQSVIPIGGISKYEGSDEFKKEDSTIDEKERDYLLEWDYIAPYMPKFEEAKGRIMGMAIFKDDKMIGEMDGEDVVYYLMSTGEYNNNYMTIRDPKFKDEFVVIYIRQSRLPQRNVKISNGKIDISLKVSLEADFVSIQSNKDYEQKYEEFEKAVETFLRTNIKGFLEDTSKKYNSDICIFGDSAKGNFLTWNQWENFNWDDKYKEANFNVEVDFKIRRTGLMIRSVAD